MSELSPDERTQLVRALERETARLEGLVKDYKTARGNTRAKLRGGPQVPGRPS